MKKATTVLSVLFFGATLMSFQGNPECKTECENLQIEDITFIEVEEEIDLGFDTAQYLPAGFDPYAGMELDLNSLTFIEEEEEINLGFNTAAYLPIGFNAYDGMELDLDDIVYIEDEEEIDLGFNVSDYLPENFNAFSK